MVNSASIPETRWALHTVSGAVAQVPAHFLTHPVFGEYLVEVEPFAKSYHPDLWKPKTAAEYRASQGSAQVADTPSPAETPAPEAETFDAPNNNEEQVNGFE